jgi:hypothetical protein
MRDKSPKISKPSSFRYTPSLNQYIAARKKPLKIFPTPLGCSQEILLDNTRRRRLIADLSRCLVEEKPL